MVGFQGRLSIRQYMLAKPMESKFGWLQIPAIGMFWISMLTQEKTLKP